MIGGGNSALEAAIEMSGMAASVTLVSIDEWTGDAILQDKVNATGVEILKGYETLKIHGDSRVTGIDIRNRHNGDVRKLAVDGVFIEIGLAASSEYVLDLLETNGQGEIHVEHNLETGVRGVFAAGDVNAGSEKQVVIAAAEGARAALAAFSYLVHQA